MKPRQDWSEVSMEPISIDLDAFPGFKAYVGPHDKPTAYKVQREADGSVVIRFRYLDEDPFVKEFETKKGIVLELGEESHRLLGIRLPRDLLTNDPITGVKESIHENEVDEPDRLNRTAIQMVIERYVESIKKGLAHHAATV